MGVRRQNLQHPATVNLAEIRNKGRGGREEKIGPLPAGGRTGGENHNCAPGRVTVGEGEQVTNRVTLYGYFSR